MAWRRGRGLATATAVAVTLLCAGTSPAQRSGGNGASPGGHSGGGTGRTGGSYHGAYPGAYHSGGSYHYGGYHDGYYRRYGYPGLGIGIGPSYYPWLYGDYYGGRYDYGSDYSFYGVPFVYYTSPLYPALPPPDQVLAAPRRTGNTAVLSVRVPEGAELWFDGQPTRQTGPVREFESPPLRPGRDYAYEVRARWTENGQSVERDRTVTVRAGDRLNIDLLPDDR